MIPYEGHAKQTSGLLLNRRKPRQRTIVRADGHGRLGRIDLRWLDDGLGALGMVDAGQLREAIVKDSAPHGTVIEVQLGIDAGSQEEDPPSPRLARPRSELSVGLFHQVAGLQRPQSDPLAGRQILLQHRMAGKTRSTTSGEYSKAMYSRSASSAVVSGFQ